MWFAFYRLAFKFVARLHIGNFHNSIECFVNRWMHTVHQSTHKTMVYIIPIMKHCACIDSIIFLTKTIGKKTTTPIYSDCMMTIHEFTYLCFLFMVSLFIVVAKIATTKKLSNSIIKMVYVTDTQLIILIILKKFEFLLDIRKICICWKAFKHSEKKNWNSISLELEVI